MRPDIAAIRRRRVVEPSDVDDLCERVEALEKTLGEIAVMSEHIDPDVADLARAALEGEP